MGLNSEKDSQLESLLEKESYEAGGNARLALRDAAQCLHRLTQRLQIPRAAAQCLARIEAFLIAQTAS